MSAHREVESRAVERGRQKHVSTRLLLSASAVVTGTLGVIGSFLPQEVLAAAGVAPDRAVTILVQLLAASLFAFAMANWTARGSLFGGIYNRPLAIGNLTHFVVGALALVKAVTAGERDTVILLATGLYAAFAVGFALVFFRSPVKSTT